MPKDELIYIGHMLDMAKKAIEALKGKTRQQYDQDELLRLALAHLVQTIGEAAAHVSEAFQTKYPAIPWKKIIGMRHKVVHDYMYVPQFNDEVQHLGPAFAGGYPKCYEPILQTPLVEQT
jgi:uncharacterized protein with HEPN domain